MTDPDKHEDCLVYFLQLLFRKRAFREGQVQIIARALRRQSVIGLLPTGAGKSITYQLPTLLSPGFALVVDPLKSLMQDQVENLALSGIDAAIAIHSDLSIQEQTAQVRELHDGDPRFAFVAPERLQMHAFRRQLKEVSTFKPVSFVVVDEAHCVSEWGHDFRPSYLNLGRLGRDLCRYEGTEPPLVALTGTASQSVLGDIQREIGVLDPEAAITPTTFDRPELRFVIERVPSADKDTKLVGLLKRLPDDLSVPTSQFFDPRTAGLIFCRYVGSEFGVEQVKNTIQQRFVEEGVEVRLFSGSSPKGFGGDSTQWGREKIRVQRDFKANRFPVLVATPAFGMGIDKPNIRYTIHYGIPPSLEAFYQEAGRAGRDRSPAVCAIVFSDDDAAAARDFLDVNLSAEEAIARFQQLRWSERGDAARIMYFQANSFKGASVEFEKVQSMYREHVRPCWDKHSLKPGDRHSVIIPWPPGADAKNDAERAIYRLLLLGLLDDYTVDFAHRRFEATCRMLEASAVKQNLYAYVRRYKSRSYSVALDDYLTKSLLEDPIERCIDGLTWFVYEEIEKKRRAALRTIVEVMRDSTDGEGLRHALLSYLEDSPFTARVTTLAGRVEPADWWEAFKAVGDAHDARQLLGQCRRGLESNLDHPGLHFLSGLARAALPTLNVTAAADDLQAGLESLHKNYGLTEATVTQDLVAILHQIGQGAFEQVTAEVLRKYNNEDFARAAYQFARDPALRRRCAMPMLAAIRSQIASVSQSLLEV